MSDGPVSVAAFGTVLEAQVFVNRLDAEGIPAHIIDGEAGTTLGYLGAAIGGIKVHVLPRDVERATELLGEVRGEQRWGEAFGDESEWTCTRCDAAVPGEHDVCWSCGAVRPVETGADPRADADAPAFEPVSAEERTTGEDASRFEDARSRVAWAEASQESVRRRRTLFGLVLLFAFGPFALLYMGIVFLIQVLGGDAAAESEEASAQRRSDARVALGGVLFLLLAGAAALYIVTHGLPF